MYLWCLQQSLLRIPHRNKYTIILPKIVSYVLFQGFQNLTIPAKPKHSKHTRSIHVDLRAVTTSEYSAAELSTFDLLRQEVLQLKNAEFFELEILANSSNRFCVFSHSGLLSELDTKGANGGVKSCRFFDAYEMAEAVFVALYEKQVSRGWQKAILNSDLIGSDKVLDHSSPSLLWKSLF
jgi:hypothetical protein